MKKPTPKKDNKIAEPQELDGIAIVMNAFKRNPQHFRDLLRNTRRQECCCKTAQSDPHFSQ